MNKSKKIQLWGVHLHFTSIVGTARSDVDLLRGVFFCRLFKDKELGPKNKQGKEPESSPSISFHSLILQNQIQQQCTITCKKWFDHSLGLLKIVRP